MILLIYRVTMNYLQERYCLSTLKVIEVKSATCFILPLCSFSMKKAFIVKIMKRKRVSPSIFSFETFYQNTSKRDVFFESNSFREWMQSLFCNSKFAKEVSIRLMCLHQLLAYLGVSRYQGK